MNWRHSVAHLWFAFSQTGDMGLDMGGQTDPLAYRQDGEFGICFIDGTVGNYAAAALGTIQTMNYRAVARISESK